MNKFEYEKHFDALSKKDLFLFERKSKQTYEIANSALNNLIIPFPNFDAADFKENFNWEIDNKKFGKSYQLYIQSLRVINDLLIVYNEKDDITYLNKAKEIIDSWIEYKNTNPQNDMIWYDHPAANRAQLIVQFLYYASSCMDLNYENYIKVLEDHVDVLTDNTLYNFNNHGLMMDKTLFVLGIALDRKDIFEHGLRRATETFWYNFSSNGIHLENSPDYHAMVVGMYREIQGYINNFGYSFSEHILKYLDKAKGYFDILVKPNGHLPQIGDSNNTPYKIENKVYENLNDFESGMNIIQRKKEKPFYLTFITGYTTQVHKHFDDLSIILNYNKEDIFVDPGKFNYSSSPLRRYVRSAKSHSTIYFPTVRYTRGNENRYTRKIRTTGYNHFKDYSIVSGINESFNDSEYLSRTVISFNSHDFIILIDSSNSETDLPIVQNFNLDEKVEVSSHKKGEVVLTKNDETIRIHQYLSSEYKIINGEDEDIIAKNTVGFGKVTNTRQINYFSTSQSDKAVNFLTLINLNNHNYNVVDLNSSFLSITIEDFNYHIPL